MEAGLSIEVIKDESRQRPILVDVWYPVSNQTPKRYDYGLGVGDVVESGQIAEGIFPLVIISHGAMGAGRNYSWIAEALARKGYIVAGVSHYGESYMYGEDTIDPLAPLRSWDRALDVSAAITHMSNITPLHSAVDTNRIGFLGHSSGGATGLQLAGGLFDSQKMAEYCNSPIASGDKGCEYASDTSVDPDISQESASYLDKRIKVFVLMDPALGPGFSDVSDVVDASKILIIGSVENDFLPYKSHAGRIANLLPAAKSHRLVNGEGHFVYLNSCESDIEANGVPLCVDRDGVSRDEVHASLMGLIEDHFSSSFE